MFVCTTTFSRMTIRSLKIDSSRSRKTVWSRRKSLFLLRAAALRAEILLMMKNSRALIITKKLKFGMEPNSDLESIYKGEWDNSETSQPLLSIDYNPWIKTTFHVLQSNNCSTNCVFSIHHLCKFELKHRFVIYSYAQSKVRQQIGEQHVPLQQIMERIIKVLSIYLQKDPKSGYETCNTPNPE